MATTTTSSSSSSSSGLRSLTMLNELHGYLRPPSPPPPPSLSDQLAALSHGGQKPLTRDLSPDGCNEAAGIRVAAAGAKGLGVFATRHMAAQAVVGEYHGERLTAALHDARYGEHVEALGEYVFRVSADILIDAEDPMLAGWTRYLNHDDAAPNLAVRTLASGHGGQPRVWFVSTRNIDPGEELLFHYGDTFWGADEQPLGSGDDTQMNLA